MIPSRHHFRADAVLITCLYRPNIGPGVTSGPNFMLEVTMPQDIAAEILAATAEVGTPQDDPRPVTKDTGLDLGADRVFVWFKDVLLTTLLDALANAGYIFKETAPTFPTMLAANA